MDVCERAGAALGTELQAARSRHTASLLADGGVLLWGGVDAQGQPLTTGEVIEPKVPAVRFEASPIQHFRDPRLPLLEDSLPINGASGVPLGTLIALRFSKPLNVATLNNSTVVLSSPEGGVTAGSVCSAAIDTDTRLYPWPQSGCTGSWR